jgi:hypothetical protein
MGHIRDPALAALKGIHVPGGLTVEHGEIGAHPEPAHDAQNADDDQDGAGPKKALGPLGG